MATVYDHNGTINADKVIYGQQSNDYAIVIKAAGLAVTLCVAYLLTTSIQTWYRLKHIPGPWTAGFSREWLIRKTWSGDCWLHLGRLTDKLGPVVRVGPNDIVTCDVEGLRRIYSARTKYIRSSWYASLRLDPEKDNIISQQDPDMHKILRSKMAAGYAGKENEFLEQNIDDQVVNFVALINRKYLSTDTEYKRLDFARVATFFTLDVVTCLAFGEPFGYITNDKDMHDWNTTLAIVMPYMVILSLIPSLNQMRRWRLVRIFVPSEKDKIGMGRVIGYGKEIVAERFGPNKKVKKDMLGSYIRHGLTQEEASSEALINILAGSDTTVTGVRATMLHILTNPRVHKKLVAEIDAAVAAGTISSPIQDAEAKRLPYLQMCIKEGLRIFPPATAIIPKVCPPEGDVIAGVRIPGGTNVGYCAWGVMRSKAVFGEDADVFRPERWEENDPAKLKSMQESADLLFSPGKWQCLGKNIAILELNKIFVEMLRNFDFALENPTKPWKSINAAGFIQSEMWMRVSKRGE